MSVGLPQFWKVSASWDAYKCHIWIASGTMSTNTDFGVIPGGLTNHLQPADVSWNKPLKAAYKAKYNEWMATGEELLETCGLPAKHCACSG